MTQRRWMCPHCKATGWSHDGSMPPHDRTSGVSCRASGQRSESELKSTFKAPPVPYVDTCLITDSDGVTRRLSFQIRVF